MLAEWTGCRQEGTNLAKIMGRTIPGRRTSSYKGCSEEKQLGVFEETREDQAGKGRGGGGGVDQDTSSGGSKSQGSDKGLCRPSDGCCLWCFSPSVRHSMNSVFPQQHFRTVVVLLPKGSPRIWAGPQCCLGPSATPSPCPSHSSEDSSPFESMFFL